jgi:hypothetical protein
VKIFIIGFLAILACVCFYLLKSDQKKLKTIIWITYTSIFAIAFYLALDNVIRIINNPPIWDFPAFYLYGKVAAEGYNFYLPENFQIIFNSLQSTFSNFTGLDYFILEVVNVGFPYPPPTMLYFIPLGFLSFHTALVVWTIFISLFLFGSIYLVYTMFLKEYKLNGLILATILFFLFSPVRSTIFYTQTNCILLFLLLLMKKYEATKYAGIFLALAIFTKPYMIVFVLALIIYKNWNALIYFTLSSIAIVGLAVTLFGNQIFISYIFNNSINRLPREVFSEDINQSLHAVLIRANLISLDKPMAYTYLSIGVLLVALGYLLFLVKRKLYDYIWAVLLLIALILYPGTLSYYGVLLLFIIFQFFDKKNQLGYSAFWNISIIGIFYCLSTFSVFTSICFLLIVVVLKSLGFLSQINPLFLKKFTN